MRPLHNLTTHETPTAALTPHPRNARNGDTDAIAASLQVNGQYKPIVVTTGGVILAGNHTYAAAMSLGWDTIATVTLDLDPNSPEAVRIMLADNRTADLGQYDEGLLLGLLTTLDDLDGTGYLTSDVDALNALLDDPLDLGDGDDDGRAPTTGELLAVADVTVGEPEHTVHHGQKWALGHHLLIVARVVDEHHLWVEHLTPDRLFCPYPDPYLPLADKPREQACLFVQPNTYLAGHLLDKYAAAFGHDQITAVR